MSDTGFQVMQMVVAIMKESEMKLSDDLLDAIVDKVINHFPVETIECVDIIELVYMADICGR